MEALATSKALDISNLAEFYDHSTRVAPNREVWQTIALLSPAGDQLLNPSTSPSRMSW